MTTGATGGAALAGIALQGGSTLTILSDRLEAAGVSYPLADISWVGLVNDPAAPQGTRPLPAVAWHMATGQYASATPTDPPQAWQILEALYTNRPELRTELPPPAPSTARPGAWGPPPPYGYAAHGFAPYGSAQQPDHSQTVMAGLAHLSIFFGALIVPLILWLVNRGSAPYAARQSKQAFFFHLAIWVIELVFLIPAALIYFSWIFSFTASMSTPRSPYAPIPPIAPAQVAGMVILYGVVFCIQIAAIVFGVMGAVKAFKGEPYHYPLLGGLS